MGVAKACDGDDAGREKRIMHVHVRPKLGSPAREAQLGLDVDADGNFPTPSRPEEREAETAVTKPSLEGQKTPRRLPARAAIASTADAIKKARS